MLGRRREGKSIVSRVGAGDVCCGYHGQRNERTNIYVPGEMTPTCSLEMMIIKQNWSYFEHIMRQDYSVENSIKPRMCSRIHKRGRPRIRWADDMKPIAGMCLGDHETAVKDRDNWRTIIMTVTSSWHRFDGTR